MSRGRSRDMCSGSGQCMTTDSSTATSMASSTSRRVSGGLGARTLRGGRNTCQLRDEAGGRMPPTSEVNEIHGVIGGQSRIERVDRAIARLAEQQHGVVARSQVRSLGVGDDAIDDRIKAGRLHVLYRGVYAVGHRVLTPHGRWMAGVLASGGGAVLSHRAAGALWGIYPWTGVEVTVTHARRTPRGIRLRYLPLPANEVTSARRVPVTTASRTLLVLATVLRVAQLERVANEVEIQGHTERLSLADLV